MSLLVRLLTLHLLAGSDLVGQVTTGPVAVPGAIVTATHGDARLVTVTDWQGLYRFSDVPDGVWSVRVDMLGFVSVTQDVRMPQAGAIPRFELTLVRAGDLSRDIGLTGIAPRASEGTETSAVGNIASALDAPMERVDETPAASAGDRSTAAVDGFLVNGSVHNAAASPFAQLRAFGNNRPRQRSLYNGGIGVAGGTSAWDARPYSFSAFDAPRPAYANVHVTGTLGGPLKLPRMAGRQPTFFVAVQRTADTNAATRSTLLPTAREREGDFSQNVSATGAGRTLIDPRSGEPFPGGVIPRDRLSPQAVSLLRYYPEPNVAGDDRFNYQWPVVNDARQYDVQARLTQPVSRRSQLAGTFAYQREATTMIDAFQFVDVATHAGVDAAVNWNYRVSPVFSWRARYQLTSITARTSPYFSNRVNVSGEAGIAGNNQEPVNWGPPNLFFSDGIAGFDGVVAGTSRNRTYGGVFEIYANRGRHNLTVGADLRRHHLDVDEQQNPRGTFTFTGAASGSDIADFLLGLPATSAVAFGNADKRFRGWSQALYLADDWRVAHGLTINAGARWEFESPLTEHANRLVNLDVAPGFVTATPVLASTPTGRTTATRYGRALMRPDWRGIQPRVAVSWRPIAGSSLLVRAGYGIYRTMAVYQSIVPLLAQQPPLSNTFVAESTSGGPLTMADSFVAGASSPQNTFAVDPTFRVGGAHKWQAELQRDLPASLTGRVTYSGTRGRHLPRAFMPNTYPPEAAHPCPACPTGFVYLTSDGSSFQHSLQMQLRRRLRNGLAAVVQYTVSTARDNAPALGHAQAIASAVAQDWLNLDAEWARSAFDQRHLAVAQFEYATGVGTSGGGLLDGWKGRLWKNWTMTGHLTAGSGLPLTPIVMQPMPGAGLAGMIRASVDRNSFVTPAAGEWGTAARHSVAGPRQFLLDAGITRTFPWGERVQLDWRVDATNVLNRVTFASINTIVGSPQFGAPVRANSMRRVRTSVRVRF